MKKQKKCKKKPGISLIVLVITIIVMIILVGTVVITVNNGGIIELANKVTFKQNLKNYLTDLGSYKSKKLTKNPSLHSSEINSTDETLNLMIASMKEQDINNFTVKGGELMYKGEDSKQAIWCGEMGISVITGYDEDQNLNSPKLDEAMIPVKYDASTGNWVKADKSNTNYDWYKYDDMERKWANVVTVKANGTKTREYYKTAPVNTTVAMDDITTMFVWIPRYAYSINEGYYKVTDALSESAEASNQKLDITFLAGNSDLGEEIQDVYTKFAKDYDASILEPGDATPKIVHPAFTFGEDELPGIWVAKFEASGSTETPEDFATYPGNVSESSNKKPDITDETYITVLPSVPSWRMIWVGDAQTESMEMAKDPNNAYGFENIDTHLTKNIEWGAVAYLSASKYGKVPLINKTGKRNSSSSDYNIFTGYQGTTEKYDTQVGMTASTTHNIYGIYDMNGGALEKVAGYIDNGNSNLSYCAGQYFENNVLKVEYTKYWDKYDVSEEEKNDKIRVMDLGDGITEATQDILYLLTKNINGTQVYTTGWNTARYRIAKVRYDLMASRKGDAMYEITDTNTYYGVWKNPNTNVYGWNWLKEEDAITGSHAISWNSDYFQLMYTRIAFVTRGSSYLYDKPSGAFNSSGDKGTQYTHAGFRPVCIVL